MNTTLTETCACGATFATTSEYASNTRAAARAWREGHRHAESVGICGDVLPMVWPAHGDQIPPPPPHCILKAGHAGMHSDGEGHWMSPTPDDAEGAL